MLFSRDPTRDSTRALRETHNSENGPFENGPCGPFGPINSVNLTFILSTWCMEYVSTAPYRVLVKILARLANHLANVIHMSS